MIKNAVILAIQVLRLFQICLNYEMIKIKELRLNVNQVNLIKNQKYLCNKLKK